MESEPFSSNIPGAFLVFLAALCAGFWTLAGIDAARAVGRAYESSVEAEEIQIPILHAVAPAEEEVQTETEESIPAALPPPSLPSELEFSPPVVPSQPPVPGPDRHVALFLTSTSGADDEFVEGTMDDLHGLERPAIVVDVKGSSVYFDATSPLAKELGLVKPVLGDMSAFVERAHAKGVAVIARFIAIKDPGLARSAPETQIRHPRTRRSVGDVWVDPAHPMSLAYNAEVLRDLVRAGIDEINLDYIRYPTEYGKEEVGMSWREKADRLEEFLKMARAVIDREGKGTRLGISTFAILGWNYEQNLVHLGQDVRRFASLVDVISPMAYPSTFAEGAYYDKTVHRGSRMYSLVYRTLTGYRELLGPEHAWKLRPWIQGYFVSQKNVRDEMQAVSDAGLCGFMVWNADNEYGPVLKALKDWKTPAGCV